MNKQQIKESKLLDLYNDKLVKFISNNKLDDSPEYILNCIVSADPDKGENSKWLINNTLNGNIPWEDIEDGSDSQAFNTLSNFIKLSDISFIDINNYKNLSEINNICQLYDKVLPIDNEHILAETDILYNKNGYLVLSPNTKDSFLFWGNETSWISSNDDEDKSYYNNDDNLGFYSDDELELYDNDQKIPLYICILPDGSKYQFHEDGGVMDKNNNEVEDITDPVLRKLAIFIGNINNIDIDKLTQKECQIAIQQNLKNINLLNINSKNYENSCYFLLQNNIANILLMDYNSPFYKDFCKLICSKDLNNIKYVNSNSDYYNEICSIAVKLDYNNLQYVNENFKNYIELCELAIKNNSHAIKLIDKNLPSYKILCELAVQKNGYSIKHIDKNLPYYKELCKTAVKKTGLSIQYIDSSLPYYKSCCKFACKQNGLAIQHINNNSFLYEDYKELLTISIKQNGLAIQHIDKTLPYYKDLCEIAIKQNKDSIQYINKKLPYYNELLELSKQENINNKKAKSSNLKKEKSIIDNSYVSLDYFKHMNKIPHIVINEELLKNELNNISFKKNINRNITNNM